MGERHLRCERECEQDFGGALRREDTIVAARRVRAGQASFEPRNNYDAVALQAACMILHGKVVYFSGESTTLREAQTSPEWLRWQGALKHEIDGQYSRGVWKAVDRHKGKILLDTRLELNRKISSQTFPSRTRGRSRTPWNATCFAIGRRRR